MKTKNIRIRLTESDKLLLQAKAKEKGITVTALCVEGGKNAVIQQVVKNPISFEQWAKLAVHVANFNQCMRAVHRKVVPRELRDLLVHNLAVLHSIREELLK